MCIGGFMSFLKISFLFFLLPSFGFAAEGVFEFSNEVFVSQVSRVEIVYPESPQGQTRLEELINDGYVCPVALQFRRCRKIIEESTFPEKIKSYQPKFSQITFGPIKSLNTLYQGEGYTQYLADQDVYTSEQHYSPVKYIEMKDFTKVTVGDVNSYNYLGFVIGAEHILHTLDVTVTDSKWVFRTYSLEVKYTLTKSSQVP